MPEVLKTITPLQFRAKYAMLDINRKTIGEGETQLLLDDENLGLKPSNGVARNIELRIITSITAADYRVELEMESGETLVFTQLGKDFENFTHQLSVRRNELILTDLLMQESLKMEGISASFTRIEDGQIKQQGQCDLRLYQTALVLIPDVGNPVRLPFSEITTVDKADYKLTISTEERAEYILSQMGRGLDPFHLLIANLMSELALQSQLLVKELMPSASPHVVLALANLMKEGRATRRSDIEDVAGKIPWKELEQHILSSEAAEEYQFLVSIGQADDACIGIKRGIRAEDRYYIWFMLPVYSTDTTKPGNAVIMESVSAPGESRATYAFRLMPRKDYPAIKTIGEFKAEMASFAKNISRALTAVNFRREPIFLTREMLIRPQYARYRYSINLMPELRELRWLYIGRIMHRTAEQWQDDLGNLLAFNTGTQNDKSVWRDKDAPADSG